MTARPRLPPYQQRKLGGGRWIGGPAARVNLGQPNRRILGVTVIDGVEHSYHATEGWRSKRIAPPEARS